MEGTSLKILNTMTPGLLCRVVQRNYYWQQKNPLFPIVYLLF